MAKTHTVTMTYAGGGPSPVQKTVSATGQSEVNYSQACGQGTTTLSPTLAIDPDANLESFAFVADGNCTLQFAGSATTSINLTANVAHIQVADEGTGLIPEVPTSADTYTLRILNAATTTVNVDLRMIRAA